ncbi:MAG: hypothetical protein IKO80_02490 [Lachnospiraceae bacterium]|nr:hypothetical protein [Lachnospiraceae bacterium]
MKIMTDRIKRYLTAAVMMFTLVLQTVMPLTGTATVYAAADPGTGAPAVELGTGALYNPQGAGSEWNGCYVYFGNQGNYPICFRVLDKNSTAYGAGSILLDSAYALSRRHMDENGGTDYANSSIRSYLNSEFYMGNFSRTERQAILQSSGNGGDTPLSGDYIFLPDQSEMQDAAYGLGNPGTLAKENMRIYDTDATYALRTAAGSGYAAVDAAGNMTSVSPDELVYIAPALNLNPDAIAFTYPAEEYKPVYLAPVATTDDNYYQLTLKGGSGFAAARKDNSNNVVPAGYGFLVDVQSIGEADPGVNYSGISGMLTDADGNVTAYGMLSEIAATGDVLVNIPAETPAGDYTLYVFAEDVRSVHIDHAVDYASNFAAIKIRVGEANAVSEEVKEAIDTQNEKKQQVAGAKKKTEQSAQASQAVAQKTQTKQADQKQAPKAVAHKISLEIEGKGQLKSNVATATVGSVIVLTPTPDKDWHFKEWQSGDVSVASDNKFTMPDKDITVKALFEKNSNNHAVKLGYMENSTVELSATSAVKGTKIKAKCNPKTGFHFVKWNSEGLTNDLKNENPITFTMPDNDVLIQAVCERDQAKLYKITVSESGQGSAYAEYDKAQANVWVNVYATPARGWRFVRWDSREVNPGGQFKFLMPAKEVRLTAVFEKNPESTYAVSTVTRGEGGQLWTTSDKGSPRTGFTRGEKVMVQTKLQNGYILQSLRADGVDLTTDSRTGAKYFYMPERNVTLTAVFEKEAEQEHEAYLVVSGDGGAWTQNTKGENVRFFKEGEQVLIQTTSNTSQLDSITSRDAKISMVSDGSYSASFTMPKGGATVYVNFKKADEEYEAYLVVKGEGSAWTCDSSDKKRTKFRTGERVFIGIDTSKAELDSIKSNDVTLNRAAGAYESYFDMPGGGATVYVNFKDVPAPAPAPDPTYKVTIRTSGDGSAWTQKADGTNTDTFKAGEQVILQTVHNTAPIESIGSADVAVQTGAPGDGSFTMPSKNVSITIKFGTAVRKNDVVIGSVNGPGNVYVTGADGSARNRFSAGDKVYLNLSGDNVVWDRWEWDDSALNVGVEGNRLAFTMPDHNVTLTIYTKSTAAPEPEQQPDPASVAIVTDDGSEASAWDVDWEELLAVFEEEEAGSETGAETGAEEGGEADG